VQRSAIVATRERGSGAPLVVTSEQRDAGDRRSSPLLQFPIIAGGTIPDDVRTQVADGRRARIDLLEMERVFNSPLYDFGFLHRASKQSVRGRAALFVARRSGTWTPALAAEVLGRTRGDDVIYATGEDVGFALAARARTLHVHKPRIVMRLEQPDYGRTPLRRSLYEQYRAYALPRISTG
jgi:hypothetical protein